MAFTVRNYTLIFFSKIDSAISKLISVMNTGFSILGRKKHSPRVRRLAIHILLSIQYTKKVLSSSIR